MTEVLQHRLLRERAFRPEERHLEWFLLGEARRHDLAEQPHDLLVRERPARLAVAVDRQPQDLRLAFWTIEIHRVPGRVLGNADLSGEARPLADEFVNPRVDGIDEVAHFRDPLLAGRRCRLQLAVPWLAAGLLRRLAGLARHDQTSLAPSTPSMARRRSRTSGGIAASVSMSV